MEEILDILDEEGKPTGMTELRSVAHTNGLWHSIVHVYFYRKVGSESELLVHLRGKTNERNPGRWDTRFGGHVRAGLTLIETAEKEVKEEISLTIDPKKLVIGPTLKRGKFPINEFSTAYFYQYDGDILSLVFKDGEVSEVKWMNLFEISESMNANPTLWAGSQETFSKIKTFLQTL